MNVLVLDEEFPFPTNAGKRTRSFNIYRRLAKQFRIYYVGYGEPDSPSARALSAEGITPIAVRARVRQKCGPGFYVRLFENLFSPLPYIVTSHRSSVYQGVVQASLVEYRPDIVVCEWTPYAIFVKGISSCPKLLSTHNIESDIWKRYDENESNGFRRWYIRKQWRKILLFERACLQWMNGAVAVSELDRQCLGQWRPDLSTAVVPNGVDLEYFQPMAQPRARQSLVFTGSMDWRPNQDAARYFVLEILPLLRRVRPYLECTFVGRCPPAEVQALADIPGVHISGTVADVRPYVRSAAVYIVPLRIGGGSRLKILEAMAMGRAIVSTTVGAEGLDVTHDQHVLLADDPRCFAESVLRLLDNPRRCEELAMEGRRLVEGCYGWDALADRFGDVIREIGLNEAIGDTGNSQFLADERFGAG